MRSSIQRVKTNFLKLLQLLFGMLDECFGGDAACKNDSNTFDVFEFWLTAFAFD
jgi:hypothetical protein